MDDETLYRRVMQGDEAALGELVARYHRPLYGFMYRFTGDAALAQDLVQETFTRFLTYRGVPPQRFKSWAFTIASNLARDHFKSARYRYERVTDFDDNAEDLPADFAFSQTDHSDVAAALAALSPDHREVIILRFYHDLKLEEIADVTGAPLGTVKSRLFHALKGLKRFLAPTEISYDRP